MNIINSAMFSKKERDIKVLQFGEGGFLRAFVDYMIDIMNENLTAKSRSSPRAMPAVIVLPEREIPGIVATHWQRPMMSASFTVMLRSVRLPWGMRSEMKRMQPVRMKNRPMAIVW